MAEPKVFGLLKNSVVHAELRDYLLIQLVISDLVGTRLVNVYV